MERPLLSVGHSWSGLRSGIERLALLLQRFYEAIETGLLDLGLQSAANGRHHADAGDSDVEQLPYTVTAMQPVVDIDSLAVGERDDRPYGGKVLPGLLAHGQVLDGNICIRRQGRGVAAKHQRMEVREESLPLLRGRPPPVLAENEFRESE